MHELEGAPLSLYRFWVGFTVVVCLYLHLLGATEKKLSDPSNVSTRLNNASAHLSFFGDVFLWCAKESGAENWAQAFNTASNGDLAIDIGEVSFDWDLGFRVGVGYGMEHDQWDTRLYYTGFWTAGSDSLTTESGEIASGFVGNFYVDNAAGARFGPSYRKARIEWSIDFNIFDWDLGRSFWVSSAISMRPFIGIKGGWIHQSIDTRWEDPVPTQNIPDPNAFGVARENLKNNFWGIGPNVGLSTQWKFYSFGSNVLCILGDLSVALLYGHWTFEDVYKNEVPDRVALDISHINSGATAIRTFLGLEWGSDWNKCQYRISAYLGYEAQFWLDQLQFLSLSTGRLSNPLTLQGGTFGVRFEF